MPKEVLQEIQDCKETQKTSPLIAITACFLLDSLFTCYGNILLAIDLKAALD